MRLWDPVDSSGQAQPQLVKVKPGYYRTEQEEDGKERRFSEVKRVSVASQSLQLTSGFLATPFSDGEQEGSRMVQLEFLVSSSAQGVGLFLVHRQPIALPFSRSDKVPMGVVAQMQEELKALVDQALRSKRAKAICVEKEMHREIVKEQVNRNLIKLSKQLIYETTRAGRSGAAEQVEEGILKEVRSACKVSESVGFDLSFIFNLLRGCKCLNPHNISFEEFKVLIVSGEAALADKTSRNRIEQKLRELIRDGQLDLELEFSK